MKIVHIIAECNHASSGTSYFITHASAALANSGATVEVHALGAPRIEGVNVRNYRRAAGFLGHIGWSSQMLAGLRMAVENADVIHSNGIWLMPNVYSAWVKPRKLVVSPHGMLSPWALGHSKWKKKIFGLLCQNAALKAADMFFATSVKECEEIRAAGYRQPVAVIPIGIGVPSEVSKKQKTAGEMKKIVFLGRLHPVKAIDRLLEAWNRCRAEGWEIVVAGPDAGAKGELEGLIAAKKIPRVRIVGGILGPDKEKFLQEADIWPW